MADPKDDVDHVVAGLSLEEQVELGVGEDFWHTKAYPGKGVPALVVSDGPNGLRFQGASHEHVGHPGEAALATCYPCSATVAATWDRRLAFDVGRSIGSEARALGVGVVLGPGLNIQRSPCCGRNFEYYSEDPLLAGEMGAAFVEGVQSMGVGSCIKHFALNSQEYKRFSNDAQADERTMRELYLSAFERVIKLAHPVMLMSAYNKVNGTYCSDNAWLLKDVLREEWGFGGVVVTDWGGMHDRVAAYEAGCDLAMPGGSHHQQRRALSAVKAGLLDPELIHASAARLVRLALRQESLAENSPAADLIACHTVALQAAREGIVLLSNKAALPLVAGQKVALIGSMARSPRYQGAGSSHINCRGVSSLLACEPTWTYAEGYDEDGATSEVLLAAAVETARSADISVVLVGLPEKFESEGFDRASMSLPEGMLRIVHEVCAASSRSVVVLLGGSPMELPFADEADALIWAGLGGEACSEALDDVLRGVVSPSGRLAESWPIRYADAPCSGFWGKLHRDGQYREGLYVGYRYYESAGVPVRFCFGHGLSYVTFEYAQLSVKAGGASVSLRVANSGPCDGAEVVQAYVEPPVGGPYRPRRILAGFERIFLVAGESQEVRISLDPRAFQVWDGSWKQVAGDYVIAVGASVQDIRLRTSVHLGGEALSAPSWQAGSWYEQPHGLPSQRDFELMLGHKIVEHVPSKGSYNEESTLLDLSGTSRLARLVVEAMTGAIVRHGGGDPDDPNCHMAIASSVDNALFGLVNISGGAFPEAVMKLLLRIAN